MSVSFAFVHHANQYLITEGYENRQGLKEVLGSPFADVGLWRILHLHRVHRIPANIHVSGTLLEAIAWYLPAFLDALREMHREGLIEFVGSCYGQNMMPFCSYDHNLKQLNEELLLYQVHLGLDPASVKTFWPPERLWDPGTMSAVLKDLRLLNRGYAQVVVDDRLLLPIDGSGRGRHSYDRDSYWHPEMFQTYRFANAHDLRAIPIAQNLRRSIPPRDTDDWESLRSQLRCLASLEPGSSRTNVLAVYADDMEKAAGVSPWDSRGASQFEDVLRWMAENQWIRPVKITDWSASNRTPAARTIDTGTYVELANHFHAGEDYRNWYHDPQWKQYANYFCWSEMRVKHFVQLGADPSLIDLAHKHLLASSWETGWHTPDSGPHGSADGSGTPNPSMKAVASHSRHAAVIAEAAFWMRHKDGLSHAYLQDIDGDGEQELIFKNHQLFSVFSPRWGGRLVYLFSVGGSRGIMLVGNPSDDWNWMEELNKYMEVPRNHPGALADIGFENDCYSTTVLSADGATVRAQLTHDKAGTAGHGLMKDIVLESYETNKLIVTYTLPDGLNGLGIECGLSPDYLNLLRYGRSIMQRSETASCRGFHTGEAAVFVHKNGGHVEWTKTSSEEFGHGARIAIYAADRQFTLSIEAIAQLDIQPELESHQRLITGTQTTTLLRGGTGMRGHKSDSS
jgi:hypothetical protein